MCVVCLNCLSIKVLNIHKIEISLRNFLLFLLGAVGFLLGGFPLLAATVLPRDLSSFSFSLLDLGRISAALDRTLLLAGGSLVLVLLLLRTCLSISGFILFIVGVVTNIPKIRKCKFYYINESSKV